MEKINVENQIDNNDQKKEVDEIVEVETEELSQEVPAAEEVVDDPKSDVGLFLVVKSRLGNEEVKHKLVDGEEIIVGSESGCDVLIFDEYLSSKHFAVKLENGEIKVRDLNSTNGLYLKVDKSLEVKKEQSLLAGISLFSFEEK